MLFAFFPFIRAHILKGIFSIEDFDQQVNMKLPTLNSGTEWEIKNISGVGKSFDDFI